jgi:hypothetical protein
MPIVALSSLDLLLLEDTVWLALAPVDVPSYDFDPTPFFACRRPWSRPENITAIGRFGVADNYAELYAQLAVDGIRLINTPDEHRRASELTG